MPDPDSEIIRQFDDLPNWVFEEMELPTGKWKVVAYGPADSQIVFVLSERLVAIQECRMAARQVDIRLQRKKGDAPID